MVSIKKHHEDIAHFLLENGADIHLYNEDGWSCLNLAILYRLKKVFVDIINLGPNVNHCTNVSCTLFNLFLQKKVFLFLERNFSTHLCLQEWSTKFCGYFD